MYETLLFIFLIVAIFLIAMIMLQQSKDTDIGASFRASSSSAIFSSSSPTNFMVRTTTILAVMFLVISLVLGNITISSKANKENEQKNMSTLKNDSSQLTLSTIPTNDIPR